MLNRLLFFGFLLCSLTVSGCASHTANSVPNPPLASLLSTQMQDYTVNVTSVPGTIRAKRPTTLLIHILHNGAPIKPLPMGTLQATLHPGTPLKAEDPHCFTNLCSEKSPLDDVTSTSNTPQAVFQVTFPSEGTYQLTLKHIDRNHPKQEAVLTIGVLPPLR